MERKKIDSKVWPPVKSDVIHTDVLCHRDGRVVEVVSGRHTFNEAQQALLDKHGDIAGTLGSIIYFEAFPGEEVCCGCVCETERSTLLPDGKRGSGWSTTAKPFKFGATGYRYCAKCREREAAEALVAYRKTLKLLGVAE